MRSARGPGAPFFARAALYSRFYLVKMHKI